jgi:hypothetical protein
MCVSYALDSRFFHQVAGTSCVSAMLSTRASFIKSLAPHVCRIRRTASAMTPELGGTFVVWGTSVEIWANQSDEGGEVDR